MTTKTDLEPDANWEQLKNFITAGVVIQNRAGQLFYVTKVNPKNYVSVAEDGQLWNVRRTPGVQRAPRQDAFTGPIPGNAFASEFKLGSVVRLTSARLREYSRDLWVVSHLNNDSTFRLVKLGGTAKNTYLKTVLTTEIVLVKGTFQEEE